jgi:hypothetical protein
VYLSLSAYLRGITLAHTIKENDTLRKTSRKLVWGSHRPLYGVANVKSSVANGETGFKVSNFKGPIRKLLKNHVKKY